MFGDNYKNIFFFRYLFFLSEPEFIKFLKFNKYKSVFSYKITIKNVKNLLLTKCVWIKKYLLHGKSFNVNS